MIVNLVINIPDKFSTSLVTSYVRKYKVDSKLNKKLILDEIQGYVPNLNGMNYEDSKKLFKEEIQHDIDYMINNMKVKTKIETAVLLIGTKSNEYEEIVYKPIDFKVGKQPYKLRIRVSMNDQS